MSKTIKVENLVIDKNFVTQENDWVNTGLNIKFVGEDFYKKNNTIHGVFYLNYKEYKTTFKGNIDLGNFISNDAYKAFCEAKEVNKILDTWDDSQEIIFNVLKSILPTYKIF